VRASWKEDGLYMKINDETPELVAKKVISNFKCKK
jgi:hypothetical protein